MYALQDTENPYRALQAMALLANQLTILFELPVWMRHVNQNAP